MPHKIRIPKKCLFFEAIRADARLAWGGHGWSWPLKSMEELNA